MDIKKTLRISASLLLIVLIGYFYSLEFKKNWGLLRQFEIAISFRYLLISFFLFLLSFLLETYIWKVCMNKHLGRPALNFTQSIAVVNGSGILKYLPGRIWTYTAQMVWLKKYNISKSVILYVNLICILGALIVSVYLSLIYLALNTNVLSIKVIMLLFVAFILFNVLYITGNSLFMNKLILLAGRLLKKELQPLPSSKSLLLFIQVVYTCSWSLTGLGGYFLAKGIGLPILFTSIFALLAAMSLSWLVGYFVVLSPGGLGIREGMMLFMLNGVVNTQTALLFPILSRLMYLLVEAFLGLAALSLGIKYNVFSSEKTGHVEENNTARTHKG